ncbi:unnamed protein product, partial [Ectocarpus fasciculatus]
DDGELLHGQQQRSPRVEGHSARIKTGPGEEGRLVPQAHDGEAGELRVPFRHLTGPISWHHRDRHSPPLRQGAHLRPA